jgi:hypothetical protein
MPAHREGEATDGSKKKNAFFCHVLEPQKEFGFRRDGEGIVQIKGVKILKELRSGRGGGLKWGGFGSVPMRKQNP